jgi:hypothetical protein
MEVVCACTHPAYREEVELISEARAVSLAAGLRP